MKGLKILDVLLVLGIIILAILLINSIKEPILFNNIKQKREIAVIKRLKDVRTAQEVYRDITGLFAPSYDTLVNVLRNGKVPVFKAVQDPNNPDDPEAILVDTSYYRAIDTIKAMGIILDSLKYVPFSGGKTFNYFADTIDYQKTKVPVVEVSTKYKVFMGKYGDPKYAKTNSSFDPEAVLKFGDRTKPSTSGNWE